MVELTFGSFNHTFTNIDLDQAEDSTYFEFDGLVEMALANDYTLTFEAALSKDSDDSADALVQEPSDIRHFGAHAGRTFGATYAGVFVGMGEVNLSTSDEDGDSEGGQQIGVEGAYDTGNVLIFGQLASYSADGNDDEAMDDAFYGRGGAVFPAGDYGEISASLLTGRGENPDGDDIDFMGLEVQFERPFADDRGAWFVGINTLSIDVDEALEPDDESLDRTSIFAGVRWNFGNGTTKRARQLRAPITPYLVSGYTVDVVD